MFGKHHLTAMGGYSWMKDSSDGFGASNSEFPTDAYLYNKLQAGRFAELIESGEGDNKTYTLKTYGGVSSWKNESLLIGFFGRLTYNFDNRFNILATLRYEGSSKFGAGHKWGLFPAVSAGWTISNEDFLKGVDWIENLKLRAGYGKTGVIPGDSYMSLLLYDYDTSYGNYITPDGVWRPSLTPTQNANPDLKWENTQEFNVGLDFGLFHGRLFGSIDAYKKLTTDLLWDYSVPVPPNLYGSTTANVGSMSNRGIELMLGGVPVRTRNFEWSTTLTAAHNKNILESLSNDLYETEDYIDGAWTEEPTSMVLQRTYIGGSLGDFYMLKSTGLGTARSNKGLWMIENPATGESDMFVDGMRSYDSSYRQYLGSRLPIVTLGWSNTLRLFNFEQYLPPVQLRPDHGFLQPARPQDLQLPADVLREPEHRPEPLQERGAARLRRRPLAFPAAGGRELLPGRRRLPEAGQPQPRLHLQHFEGQVSGPRPYLLLRRECLLPDEVPGHRPGNVHQRPLRLRRGLPQQVSDHPHLDRRREPHFRQQVNKEDTI